MGALSDKDPNSRCALKSARLDVPAFPLEHGVPSRGDAREVGHRPSRREAEPRRLGSPTRSKTQPPATSSATEAEGPQTYTDPVPGGRQPVGTHGGGHGAADDEAEVAGARERDDPRLGGLGQLLDHLGGILTGVRQLPSERAAQLVNACRLAHRRSETASR